MSKNNKRILSLIFTLAIILCSLPFAFANAGDTFTYGYYPQTKLDETEDAATISALNSAVSAGDFISYGYYSGNGKKFDDYGNLAYAQSDYMKYADVTYNGTKYRGVFFTEYRPESNYAAFPTEIYSANGQYEYSKNTVYWFRYEPITWTVVSESEGESLAVADKILTCDAYRNTYSYEEKDSVVYDYDSSTIKDWLINDFSVLAFGHTDSSIRLLSVDEATAISAGSTGLLASSTDYANINRTAGNTTVRGVANCSSWWLNTPADATTANNYSAALVVVSGSLRRTGDVNYIYGIRPAMTFETASGKSDKYTVTYNADGGIFSDGTDSKSETLSAGEVLSPETPVKDGSLFTGWTYTDSEGNAYTGTTMPASDLTAVANWATSQVISVAADKDYYIRGEYITFTVKSTTDITAIKLAYNYTGSDGTKKSYVSVYTNSNSTVTDENGLRTWTITKKAAYTPSDSSMMQNYTVYFRNTESNQWHSFDNNTLSVKIYLDQASYIAENVTEEYAPYTLIDASAPESAALNSCVTVTIRTTDDCSKVRIYNGTKYATYQTTSKNVSYSDENGIRTWSIRYKVTASGAHTVTARGKAWGEGKTFTITAE